MEKYSRVAKNAILGDGMLRINKKTAAITYISTDLKLLAHKERLLTKEGISVTVKKTQESGYGGTKTIYVYSTTADERVKEAADAGVSELLQDLTKEDIFLWYLDDGSWHIDRHTMHLYSNELNDEHSNLLISRIEILFGIAPTLRVDRKKDGREFNYLYFPRDLVRIVRPEIKKYIIENGIDTMLYKIGGIDFEEKPRKELTNDQVRNIRLLHKEEGMSADKIAEKFGYHIERIKNILNRKTYKKVV